LIWTRIKRWLATHPLWSLLVSSWLSFAIVLVPLGAMLAIGLGRNMGNQQAAVFLSAVLTGLWLLATGASAYGFGILSAKSGLPIRAIRRRWPWLWAGLAPLWLPISLTAALSRFDDMWIVPAMALTATATLSASGMLCMLAGLGLAGNRARRQLAAGRWVTVAPVSPEMYGPAASERRRINRRTIATLSVATAAAVFGYLALLCCIYRSDMIDDGNKDKVMGWSLAALAIGYIILTATMAVRRHRAGLTNTDLVLIGALQPWLVWPVLVMSILFLDMVCEIGGGDVWLVLDIILFLAVGSPVLLAGAWLLVLLTTAAVWLIRWHRDPRYRPSAMKEFDQ
jgi:hypothetical protein